MYIYTYNCACYFIFDHHRVTDFFDIFFAYCSKTSLDSNFHFEMTFINLEFCQGTKNIIMTKSVEKNSLITLAISCILLSEKKYLKITVFRTKKFVPN